MMSVMCVSELIYPEPIQSKGILSSDDNIQMIPSEISGPGDGFGVLLTLTDSKIPFESILSRQANDFWSEPLLSTEELIRMVME